jgi:hypothetical protein
MTANYQVWLKNPSGTRIAVLVDASARPSGTPHALIRNMALTHLENRPGSLRLEINGGSRLVPLFTDDCQLEAYRQDPNTTPTPMTWYREFEGFVVGQEQHFEENSRRRFVAHAVGYLDLVFRAKILYKAGSAFTDKSGPGETVIKQLVNENIGPGASNAAREVNGVRPGLTIEADQGRGGTWEGSRAWKTLGEAISEIAAVTGLAFDIVGTGPATFEFRVYEGQRGQDRTNVGLDPSTGKNGAGNTPIVFSDRRRNIKSAYYVRSRATEINTVAVLGPGEGANRLVTMRQDAGAAAASPWNQREDTVNASQEDTTAGREARGDAELEKRQLRENFGFTPRQLPSLTYGKHYTWGDKVTGRLGDIERHKKLLGVKLSLDRGGEDIDLDFADVIGY